jgi:type II secretory pathway pseudopilin PulG
MSQNRGPEGSLGYVLGVAIAGAFQVLGEWQRKQKVAAEKAAAERAAEAARRERKRQADEQLEQVKKQNARGLAGSATLEEARAAARGRGGRENKLDQEWF